MRYISIKQNLAKVTRDINIIDTGLKNDIKAWISEAIELAQTTTQQVLMTQKGSLCDGAIELQYGVGTVLWVFLNGCWLPYGQNINGVMQYQCQPESVYIPYEEVHLPNLETKLAGLIGSPYVQHAREAIQQKVLKVSHLRNQCYWLNGNHLNSSLNKGSIEIWYEGLMVDKEGYPMCMDEPDLKEAIVNFVEYKLIKRGVMQGNSQASFQQWEYHLRKAIIHIEMPTYEQAREWFDDSGL